MKMIIVTILALKIKSLFFQASRIKKDSSDWLSFDFETLQGTVEVSFHVCLCFSVILTVYQLPLIFCPQLHHRIKPFRQQIHVVGKGIDVHHLL